MWHLASSYFHFMLYTVQVPLGLSIESLYDLGLKEAMIIDFNK